MLQINVSGHTFKMQNLALLLTLMHGVILCSGGSSDDVPRLILVSFDGFRADYLNYSLPNLQEFINDGVLVREVKNVFITKTLPNHYSIVTGLYAESHGIVANSMYDKDTNLTFSVSNSTSETKPVWWNEATPIWVTNQRAGRRSGSAMWQGTDVKIQNVTLNDYLQYNRSVPFEERVDNITSWFTRANDSINFATLYFEEPDHSGHSFGPENIFNMSNVLKDVDIKIGYLVAKLKELKLWDTVNVIITSDHGMAQCSQDRVIVLDNCIGRGNYTLVDTTPVAAILPLQDINLVYGLLKNCSDHMKVYLKDDIPDHYHYKQNSRIQPIILVADEGWTIVQNASSPVALGNHGYDNSLHSMHPFLAARGPAFHKSVRISTIDIVDIYPMMCHILGLTAEANNGSLSSTKCLLADQWCVQVPEAIGIVIGGMLVLATFTCVVIMLLKKKTPFQDDDDPLID
ncbi:bis(5'-adenosyl)-triphosphatase enpp4-like isoform X1 [Bufo bufo]|uniref:bis(5'-adenosyl)-triphosphatase enpp4-like isoform X1 n=2 Tax=Bufo bufo TaxID=8384 RepID=UPI001ABEA828|nr:bis(5'-adenosyl)-triphosphatase enpp4-like isoform X1 [Bufo bufo]